MSLQLLSNSLHKRGVVEQHLQALMEMWAEKEKETLVFSKIDAELPPPRIFEPRFLGSIKFSEQIVIAPCIN
jgi:hypothetical protein